jgi:hypothetical protein
MALTNEYNSPTQQVNDSATFHDVVHDQPPVAQLTPVSRQSMLSTDIAIDASRRPVNEALNAGYDQLDDAAAIKLGGEVLDVAEYSQSQ